MISNSEIHAARILIVDDLAANVLLLEQTLRDAGYATVTSTLDSQGVCALHLKHRYDLILLDLLMPGMDGFAVLEGLKAIDPDSYVPVLAVTAQPGHKLRALQAGARDFISKPFDLIEIKARVRNLLEVRLLYQQIETHNRTLEQTVLKRTAELQASEARFQRLTELSSDWYWEQDQNGQFTRVSGPALEMLGIRGAGAPELPLNDASPRWIESERAELDANIASRRPFLDFVYSRTNADGSEQILQVSGEPMFGPSGCYIGYRGIGMDVTARMRRC
jgi:PAS domain S-box-containing protein